MTILEAINARHSVRSYQDKQISTDIVKQLQDEINVCNGKSGLCVAHVWQDGTGQDRTNTLDLYYMYFDFLCI